MTLLFLLLCSICPPSDGLLHDQCAVIELNEWAAGVRGALLFWDGDDTLADWRWDEHQRPSVDRGGYLLIWLDKRTMRCVRFYAWQESQTVYDKEVWEARNNGYQRRGLVGRGKNPFRVVNN